ncbi:PAP2 superfamily protein [Niabella drilacis]|uniref:PAP2 superfamily protein n=1 Tax=Niabella drilacis (strain DSM 25811 / CCM 8410 / CCUG 62505 / LMG 26954 / E90) TaxID=1285928 RepID=A0A1G7ACD8_NIADE|nr:PAP2 superfamily protein [Niabella drilacis]
MLLIACKQPRSNAPELKAIAINNILTAMTDIMIHDITNPPLAARFFAYSCLAGYEVVAQHDTAFKSMYQKLNGYPDIKKPDSITGYSYQLAALLAIMETAKKLQPSGSLVGAYQQHFLDSCKRVGYDDALIKNSLRYAGTISKQILAWAKADGYNKISNYPRYTPVNKEGCWYPTPPAFLQAVEPWFKTVRSFTLDSATQFIPPPPVAFSTSRDAAFYKMLDALYKERIHQDPAHTAIAGFWDCNPFAVQDNGHLQVGLKKISPGAHWLGITGIACLKTQKGFNQSLQIHTMVAVGLMDAFICCWDEKFRSNRIRPETAIRKYIDPGWEPLLQTPPFPEYLSGHSVISATSATILTHFFGDHFSYTDSVEVSYGLHPRSFTSFQQAAVEAGISRFYGGIHFMDAIDNGRAQGLKVGQWVVDKVALPAHSE